MKKIRYFLLGHQKLFPCFSGLRTSDLILRIAHFYLEMNITKFLKYACEFWEKISGFRTTF